MTSHTDARRLPVYLLLDCSGSMAGDRIEAVRQGVKMLMGDLRTDPAAMETAHLSVITFNSTAQQLCPLTALPEFFEPPLSAGGSTALGAALKLLEQCLSTEIRVHGAAHDDWRPLVFLFTDGQPTDEWQNAADRIRAKRPANIVACAADGADPTVLRHLTDNVVVLKSLTPEALKQFLKWVSNSIKTAARVSERPIVEEAAPIGLIPPLGPMQPPLSVKEEVGREPAGKHVIAALLGTILSPGWRVAWALKQMNDAASKADGFLPLLWRLRDRVRERHGTY